MTRMTSSEIREAFLRFFAERGHEIVASAPLVPGNDPTLLFTNAGMVQFKDVFLGEDRRRYRCAASSQRCVRAGGKHNDLENVGYTARHHTFFEMLGNFSFGGYFKREAIEYAWEFLTEVLTLPAGKLWVTVYEDDDEAAAIWLDELRIDPQRFSRMGRKDNFWAMGDTGPCGPCSEIFYDHGPGVAGGPPGSPDEDGDRYVEIWNLVFMQYERAAGGELTPLPKPSVDTGMGLERIAAVMQGVYSNYEIDLFAKLTHAAADILDVANDASSSLKIIADHIRACAFLIVDGVVPGSEGRGYVLRRIARRAIRHGKKLGCDGLFFHKLVAPLAAEMGAAYPELASAAARVEKVLEKEERRFAQTLHQGMEILEKAIDGLKDRTIPGDVVFKLYDTYGFPLDLTADVARERRLAIDQPGFEAAMQAQRDKARAASKFGAVAEAMPAMAETSEFLGYESTSARAKVTALFRGGVSVDALTAGDEAAVVLSSTPFYAESGGQIGDTGILVADGARFEVSDTQKSGSASLHYGVVESGELRVGGTLDAIVDAQRREAIRLNHSATHLLHAALRQVLGKHVTQKGSLVAQDRLRFDFSHNEAVSPGDLDAIERLVNREIRANRAGEIRLMRYDDALASGAIALFGEKYDDEVRVLRFDDFSVELCGGTHVERTGDIGLFKITAESGVAAGIRRIEAMTGEAALAFIKQQQTVLEAAAAALKASPDRTADKARQLLRRNKALEKELAAARRALLAGGAAGDVTESAVAVGGLKVLTTRMDGADAKTLRDAVDRFKNKLVSGVVVVGAVEDGKVRLAAGVTKNNTDRIRAGDLIRPVAAQVGGKGGGRPDFAQAGGSDPAALDAALASVSNWVAARLQEPA